jgi:hypothetical protein
MQIRQATLDDTQSISILFRAKIERWQRMGETGRVQDLPYEQLNIYERWLHGGAWMTLETGALWLSHLLRGAGIPYVLENADLDITGYMEVFPGDEPEPYGKHLHIRRIVVDDDEAGTDALVQFLLEKHTHFDRITVSCTAYDNDTIQFYKRYGFEEVETIQQVAVPSAGGNVGFYQVSDYLQADSERIKGWSMPVGRTEAARYHWENLWPNLWQAVPKIVEQRTHRQHVNAAGHEAFVCIKQQLYNPRSADIYCWTPKMVSAQLMNSIRDWTHKQGYRTLVMAVTDKVVGLLGTNVEKTPYQQTILARDM